MVRSHKPGRDEADREAGQDSANRPGDDEAPGDDGANGGRRRRARRIIPMAPGGEGSARGNSSSDKGDRRWSWLPIRLGRLRRGGRRRTTKPEPEFRGSDIFALVIAGLQVILPYFFIILTAIVVTYLLVAAFFGM